MVAFSKIGAVCAGVPVTLGADCNGKAILVKYTTNRERKLKNVRSNVGLSFITLLSEHTKQQPEKNTQNENNASSSVEEGDKNLEPMKTDLGRWDLESEASSTEPIVRPLPSGRVINRDDESGLTYQEIELVMSKSSCSKDLAVNAILSCDGDADAAVKYLQSMNSDDLDDNDANENVDAIFEKVDCSNIWGQKSEIGTVSFREASSQIDGQVDPDGRNFTKAVVVTARQEFPRKENIDELDRYGGKVSLGICWQKGLRFRDVLPDSWASRHTNLKDYEFQDYFIVKVNSHEVNNGKEFLQVMNSLSAGDPLSFTLAQKLYIQGEGIGELFSACRSGDVAIVRRIFETNKEINPNKGLEGNDSDLRQRYGAGVVEGAAPLHVACVHGHLSLVQELLQHPSIEVNNCQRILQTPLHVACEYGRTCIVQALLTHPDIEVNAIDFNRMTPLMVAADSGFPMVVKCLLAHPKIDTTKTNEYFGTAFNYAHRSISSNSSEADRDRIRTGRKEIVQILNGYEYEKKSRDEVNKKEDQKQKQKQKQNGFFGFLDFW